MSSQITPVNKMLTLVRREFQEQRILFLYLPTLVVLLLTAAFSMIAIRSYMNNGQFVGLFGNNVTADSIEEISVALQAFSEMSQDLKATFWDRYYSTTLPFLYISFWGAMFYYFQMTLFVQRRDRSILFWNSLPVTDSETIFSKLVAGFFLCHIIYLIGIFVLQLFMILIMTMYGSMFDVPLWDNFIGPSGLVSRFGRILGISFLSIFWCLPVYGWLLFTSAWAKSAPFAWAMAPIVLFSIIEFVFFDTDFNVIRIFFEHSMPMENGGVSPRGAFYAKNQLFSMEMLASVMLGGAFIYAAIRFNRSENI